MQKLIRFFKINLAAMLVVVGIAMYIVLDFKTICNEVSCDIGYATYFTSFLLLILQFFVWKKFKMFDRDLASFFVSLLIGNLAILFLVLDASISLGRGLEFVFYPTVCIFASISFITIKLLTWLLFLLINIFKKVLHLHQPKT